MAEPILNNTLQGTMATPTIPTIEPPKGLVAPEIPQNLEGKALGGAINTLQGAQQTPSSLVNFQKAMQLSSSLAYKDRQTQELGVAGKAFDPSKVSGGTFASIIGNLEQQRGADVGKIYASTLNAYASAQEQITNRLQFLQQLQESKKQFEAEFNLKKQQIKQQMKMDKEGAKLSKKKLEQDQKNWEREFALSEQKAKADANTNDVYKNTGYYRATYPGTAQNTAPMQSSSSDKKIPSYIMFTPDM